MARDHRLDVLRGLAVVGISINHLTIVSPGLSDFPTYQFGRIFAFNFADVFIILSGIVCGIVYNKIYVTQGFENALRMSFQRIRQIWIAHALCVVGVVLVAAFWISNRAIPNEMYNPMPTGNWITEFLGNIFFFSLTPALDILPLYIIFLACLPFMLFLMNRSIHLYLALSGGLWLLTWMAGVSAQIGRPLPVIGDPNTTSFFMHPLAGQIYFFLGVFIGSRYRQVEAFITRHGAVIAACSLALLCIFDYFDQTNFAVHYFNQKDVTGPLRIISLLSVLSLIHLAFPSHEKVGIFQPFEICGRNSLPAFVASTIGAAFFTYFGESLAVDRLGFLAIAAANVTFMMSVAFAFEAMRKRKRQEKFWPAIAS